MEMLWTVIVELLQKRFKKPVVGSENDACKFSVGTFMLLIGA